MNMKDLNVRRARASLSVAIAKGGMEEHQLVQRISDDLGDEGVLWRPRRVREFLEAALREGLCCRLPICQSSGEQCNLYYPDSYRGLRWLDAHTDWVVQQAGSLPEAFGVSEETINQCRAGTSVYAVYGVNLAVVEPGLRLREIHERCAVPLGLPTIWSAHVGAEDVYKDYCAKAGDVVDFCEDVILKETPIEIKGIRTAPPAKSGVETKKNAKSKSPKSPAAYYHSASETPPESYQNNGPIAGTKKFLASVAFVGTKFDRRSLDLWVKDGLVWGQCIHHRHYRIWFQQSSDFLAAEKAANDIRRLGQEETGSK